MTLETTSNTAATSSAVAQLESLNPLMRPNQVEETLEERKRLEGQVDNEGKAPWEQASKEARQDAVKLLARMDRQLASQVPRPYSKENLDTAVRREAYLREQFTTGMPTQAEMRRNPAGAVDKHRAWEARNKNHILEWKNIRLRLHAGGDIDGVPRDASDIANMEIYRPSGGPGELNLDNVQIDPVRYFLPPSDASPAVVFTHADLELLGELNEEIRNRVIVMNNDDRRATMDILRQFRSRTANGDGSVTIETKNSSSQKTVKIKALDKQKDS